MVTSKRAAIAPEDNVASFCRPSFDFFFGAETWGEAVSRDYTDELTDRLNGLKLHPQLGPVDAQPPGFRRLRIRSHSFFYQIERDEVVIVRVLHMSEEPSQHLP